MQSLPWSPRSVRRIQQSTRERAFSGVYNSLPEGGRPEARAASNRALGRERFVSFTVFRSLVSPKRAQEETEEEEEEEVGEPQK